MIKAIIDQLKTGSIINVYPKGDVIVNKQPPYITVWGPVFIANANSPDRGKDQYFISVHVTRGFTNQLDDYIYAEVVTLLNKQQLTTRDLRKLTLRISGAPSDLIEGNDDDTISKERVFITAGIYD